MLASVLLVVRGDSLGCPCSVRSVFQPDAGTTPRSSAKASEFLSSEVRQRLYGTAFSTGLGGCHFDILAAVPAAPSRVVVPAPSWPKYA